MYDTYLKYFFMKLIIGNERATLSKKVSEK